MIKRITIVFIIAIFINGCKNNTADIQAANKVIYTLIDADNRSDIKTVLSSYTDTIEFHSANKPPLKGISNIQNSYEKLFHDNRLKIKTVIIETVIDGNTAIIKGNNTGSIEPVSGTDVKRVNDNYTAFLSKDSAGTWKISKLVWSPNN